MPGGNASLPTLTVALAIDGDSVGPADGVALDAWEWDYDAGDSIEFHEFIPGLVVPTYAPGLPVTLTLDATLRFTGEIVSVHPQLTREGWTFGYRALGPRFALSKLPITSSAGVGRMTFNATPGTRDWIPSLAGLTVGAILDAVLDQHASQLTALGIATDAATDAQLAALDLVPTEPVIVAGSLWQGVDSVLRLWAKNVVPWINSAGKWRFLDTTAAGSTLALTEGVDPFVPLRWAYDLANCATNVCVRGGPKIAGFYAKASANLLSKAWSAPQEAAWTIADFTTPIDAFDSGDVDSIDSPTTATISSADGAKTWAANFWADRQAWMHLYSSAGSGLTFSESRPVTANAALTAGGSASITLGYPLDNAGSSAYDTYELVGTAAPLSGPANNRVDVWRLYNVDDPGALVSDHLVSYFPTPHPFFGYWGDSEVKVEYPTAVVVDSNGVTMPASFKIVPESGQIRFDRPVVEIFNDPVALKRGGSAVKPPADLWVLLAYARGALNAVYPPDSGGTVYSGQAFDLFGFERTAYVDVESWVYQGNQALFDAYAESLHAAMSAPDFTGSIRYLGPCSNVFDSGTLHRVNVSASSGSTGMETLAVPVRAARLQWIHDAAGGLLYTHNIRCSSRRQVNTGERFYVHPTTIEQAVFKLPMTAAFDFTALSAIIPDFSSGRGPIVGM